MITKAIVQIIGFIVNVPCKYFLACAFSWDKSHLKCVVTETSKLRWRCGSFLMISYFLFLLCGLYGYTYDFKSESMFDTTYHTLYVIGYFCTMCDKANYLRCSQFYAPALNGILQYFLRFSEISRENQQRAGKRETFLVEICLKVLINTIFTMPIFAFVQYVRISGSSIHVSSLFVNYPILFKILYCPIGILQMGLMGSMISELTVHTILIVLVPFFYIVTFSSFRFSTRKNKHGFEFMKTIENGQPILIPFLRTAQIVGSIYGEIIQGRILPLHFVISYIISLSLFTLIQFHHALSWELILILLSTGFSAAIGWLTILWFFGEYYRSGQKFMVSWKNADWPQSSFQRKLMKKFYRSCRPIAFTTCPKIYCFRPVTMLKYLHFIIWLLAKFLIAA